MHYYHMYIVRADDLESAKFEIENKLEIYRDDVYDYYSLGLLKNNAEPIVEINKDNYKSLYGMAKKKILYSKQDLENSKERLIESMNKHNIVSFSDLEYNEKSFDTLIGFYLKKIGSHLAGYYHTDSFFFDWEKENPVTSIETFKEYAQKGGYYVIYMDLHN